MYYPKSEILYVKYSSGNLFIVKNTRAFYSGYYYATNDGKFFSGKEYNSTTVELEVSSKKSDSFVKKGYDFYYAKPSEDDYNKGFFERYVLKRVNGDMQTIKEISKEEFDSASLNPLYLCKSFTWKLTGPLYTTPEGIPGIVNTNQKTLEDLEKYIPEVTKYFTNLAQYVK